MPAKGSQYSQPLGVAPIDSLMKSIRYDRFLPPLYRRAVRVVLYIVVHIDLQFCLNGYVVHITCCLEEPLAKRRLIQPISPYRLVFIPFDDADECGLQIIDVQIDDHAFRPFLFAYLRWHFNPLWVCLYDLAL